MKELRIEVTLADVTLTLSQEFTVDVPTELEAIVKAGMANHAYRGGASKAFKGLKPAAKEALDYEAKVALLKKAMPEVGMKVIAHEPYVAPEKEVGLKTAAKYLAAAKAGNKLDHLKATVGCDSEDEQVLLVAIAAWLKNPLGL